MSVFTKDAGRVLKPAEVQKMTGAYRERKAAIGIPEDECVRSEYFGADHVLHLLNQPGCMGLRIHQAKRWEDADGKPTESNKGHLKPRVLLTGVDANGKDMPVFTDQKGMKDMPQDGGDGEAVGDGHTCPRHC